MAVRKSNNDDISNEQISALIEELLTKIERLRMRYEQYFLGIEKMQPTSLRQDVVRIMHKLEQTNLRNTAMKFRLRTATQKWQTYSQYWNRTLRQIENGTYRRHREKAKRRQQRREEAENFRGAHAQQHDERPDEEIERAKAEVANIADAADEFLASLGMAMPGAAATSSQDSFAPKPAPGLSATQDPFAAKPADGLAATADAFAPNTAAPRVRRLRSTAERRASGEFAPIQKNAPPAREPSSSLKTGGFAAALGTPAPPTQTNPQAAILPAPRVRRIRTTEERRSGQFGAVQAPDTARPQPPPSPQQRTVPPSRNAPPPHPSLGQRPATRPQQQRPAPSATTNQANQTRALYDRFVQARRQSGASGAVNYAQFESSLEKQAQRVRQKHQCNDVEFKVVMKNGKAVLKPVPK